MNCQVLEFGKTIVGSVYNCLQFTGTPAEFLHSSCLTIRFSAASADDLQGDTEQGARGDSRLLQMILTCIQP